MSSEWSKVVWVVRSSDGLYVEVCRGSVKPWTAGVLSIMSFREALRIGLAQGLKPGKARRMQIDYEIIDEGESPL